MDGMEDNLQNLPKIRTRFRGIVESISIDPNPEKARILIKDIKLLVSGRKVIYAQDFYYSYRFRKQNLKQGDPVERQNTTREKRSFLRKNPFKLSYKNL
jgi:hypothetical protein